MRELRILSRMQRTEADVLYEATYHATPQEAYNYLLADRKACAPEEVLPLRLSASSQDLVNVQYRCAR